MSDARSVEGPHKAAGPRGPRRLPRKPMESGPGPIHPSHTPAAVASPPAPRPPAGERGPGSRLDDLYRLPMPKLFALAEREGIAEHTGMNRAQLIVAVVRRQVERGEVVRGSGTLEVLPDGYGFLRRAAHNYLASPEDIYVSPRH